MVESDIKKSGQVILETALVFVSLALLLIGAVQLYTNLTLDVTGRQEKYRSSRRRAVRDTNIIAPTSFLDYSSFFSGRNSISADWGIDVDDLYLEESFFDETRLLTTESFFEELDVILNDELPIDINLAYALLGGDDNDNPPAEDITQARWLVIASAQKASRAAQLLSGVQWGREGAAVYVQNILDHPNAPGSFDYDPAHAHQRQTLSRYVDGLNTAGNVLEGTIMSVFNEALRLTLIHIDYGQIHEAKEDLKPLTYITGTADAAIPSADAILIQRTYDLLGGEDATTPSLSDAQQALSNLQALNTGFQTQLDTYVREHPDDPDASEEGFAALQRIVQEAIGYLNNAIANWGTPTGDQGITDAREHVRRINDVANP